MKRTTLAITPLCVLLSAAVAWAQPSEAPAERGDDPKSGLYEASDKNTGVTDPSRGIPDKQVADDAEELAPSEAPQPDSAGYQIPSERSADSDVELSGAAPERKPRLVEKKMLHGFRVGYNFVMNTETREDGTLELGPGSDQIKLKSPHLFVIGYEGFYRLVGHSWLNVLLVGNVSVAGLEQSKFIPSGNGLVGFEFNESFQLGVGINLTPVKDSTTHMIAAAGWTPKVGSFYTPVHLFFIPDKDGFHRTGATIGVTW